VRISVAKGEMAKFLAGMRWRVIKNFDCLEPWESADQERWESDSILVSLKFQS
jgi:hypothetical protein